MSSPRWMVRGSENTRPSSAASTGPSASTEISTTRTSDCTKLNVRPRTSSPTSSPSSVYPHTQATPPQAPRPTVRIVATTRFGTRDSRTSHSPAAVSAIPNSRRRDRPASSRGPSHMPPARPTNTAAKSTPYPAGPPPTSAANCWPRPITRPPAANAPSMPTTSPRISGVPPTNRQPSTIVRHSGCSAAIRAGEVGKASRQITSPDTR